MNGTNDMRCSTLEEDRGGHRLTNMYALIARRD
jgi:hypothetical protein